MMNSCGVQQNYVVVCPKPRRVHVLNHHHATSNSRNEILDFILAKSGSCEQDSTTTVTSSSPPLFFSGSPPSRVSNPLTKDALFRDELFMVAPPRLTPRATKTPPSMNGGGCVRASNFGNNPVVRVVGFDCLDRERCSSNRSISTLA